MTDPIQIAYLEWLIESRRAELLGVLDARNYYNGVQQDFVPSAMIDILSRHKSVGNPFTLNVCETIVTALANILNLTGFDTNETPDENGVKPLAVWANEVWKHNRMAAVQDIIHEGALSDRESFIIVDWDKESSMPRLVHNEVYIPYPGSGEGVFMVYENDDRFQKPLYAVKRWSVTDWNAREVVTNRVTIYYPDRIEKYKLDFGDAGMSEYREAGVPYPLPNVDSQGNPLGLPVIHFHNKGYRPEHWKAMTMQDGINRTLVDILYANDLVSKKSFFGFGFQPTTDGKPLKADNSNSIKIGAGVLNSIPDKKPEEASLQEIEGADPRPMIDALINLITLTAQITDTPVSRFVMTAQIASADTIKAQTEALDKKAEDRRELFGASWVQAMNIARKYANVYGNAGLDESVEFIPVWKHEATLQELEQKKNSLGIPDEQIWAEAGYSPEQIAEMKNAQSYRIAQEAALWQGAISATASIPLDEYLRRCGVSEEAITQIQESLDRQTAVPLTDL